MALLSELKDSDLPGDFFLLLLQVGGDVGFLGLNLDTGLTDLTSLYVLRS